VNVPDAGNVVESIDRKTGVVAKWPLKNLRGNYAMAQNDVFGLARSVDPAALPYIYLDCGAQDHFLAINRQFAALLQSRSIPYEFHELPGAHEWPYWDSRLPAVLDALSRTLPAL
jgi:S-formylglutathione hydrolase FrmB